MPLAIVHDYEMYYEDQGHGDPLVLVHGGCGSSAAFAGYMPVYTLHYRVIARDRKGHGRSTGMAEFPPDFLRRDALHLADFIDGLGLKQVRFFGHSDGGSIGLHLAIERPDLVRSMVLLAAHSHAEAKTLDRLRLNYEALCAPERQALHDPQDYARHMAWYAHWLNPAGGTIDLRGEMGCISCPTLVIQGTEDEFATPAHAEDIARAIPGAELWLIAGGNHGPRGGREQEFDQRVLDFFARH
jgi:pimeloyl-ACP methyl ester carboxylesterase